MIYGIRETKYLISLLSSILSDAALPEPPKTVDWGDLYKLTDVYGVAAMTYYGLLGTFDLIPVEWRDKFSREFRRSLNADKDQIREMERILRAMENGQIACVVMPTWQIKDFYPQRDMRKTEEIDILYAPERERHLVNVMNKLGYQYGGCDIFGNLSFYISSDWKIVFKKQLFAHNRGYRKYYTKIWEKAEQVEGYQFIYQLPLDTFYLTMMLDACDKYAFEQIGIIQVVDIYLFLRLYREQLNWSYIDTELKSLDSCKFSKHLEKVGEMWFNKGVKIGDEASACMDVEEYILSQGAFGRDTSVALLPIITNIQIWKIKDERRERLMKVVHWFFPEIQYMEGIYPLLENHPILIAPCWLFRMFHLVYYSIRSRAVKIYQKVFFPLNRMYENFLEKHEEKIKSEIEKREQQKALQEDKGDGAESAVDSDSSSAVESEAETNNDSREIDKDERT